MENSLVEMKMLKEVDCVRHVLRLFSGNFFLVALSSLIFPLLFDGWSLRLHTQSIESENFAVDELEVMRTWLQFLVYATICVLDIL